MPSWRDEIVSRFVPGLAPLTIAVDPDDLLADEVIAAELQHRGFELIPFEDHVTFRRRYESAYRAPRDRGEPVETSPILWTAGDPADLPDDLLHAGRLVRLSPADLFATLDSTVVRALDHSSLDRLWEIRDEIRPEPLTESETKELLLRRLFHIDVAAVARAEDLLNLLLIRHHAGNRLPAILDDYTVTSLRREGRFADWPLETLVLDRAAFLQFLQERWPLFLEQKVAAATGAARETNITYHMQVPGPLDLPFDHPPVRAHIDTLFLDGRLTPVEHASGDVLGRDWVTIGIRTDPEVERRRRLERLMGAIESDLNTVGGAADWLSLAGRWGDLSALRYASPLPGALDERIGALHANVNTALQDWLLTHFGPLYSRQRTMVHQIPRLLRRHRAESGRKIALLVLDGLSLAGWLVVRSRLPATFHYDEEALFAWVPTITPVSRQALFAGKIPRDFAPSIGTTNREGSLWESAWADVARRDEVVYLRGLGGDDTVTRVDDALRPRTQIIGLVLDTADKIMHGAVLGMSALHGQLAAWTDRGVLAGLLSMLHEREYDVFLTSDHGNVEAVGVGRPQEGVMAETRGARVRAYESEVIRARFLAAFPNAIAWPPSYGLPPDYWPLLAAAGEAFETRGERIVAHGGITLDEVVVPFLRVMMEDS
ncbi:MAG TPA: BREX-3 system phosphatase PglZ [Chloroflexota bacterium]|nr:BREX-3 system phosphatase PglZ [Chloroflexota bacterium]